MDNVVERAMLAARWLLLPLYVALLLLMAGIYAAVIREMLHLAGHLAEASETEIVLAVLTVLDLVLLANLLVMVAVSSYESFLARITTADAAQSPEWLGKLDTGHIKVKVAVSVLMISAIDLLRAYMAQGDGVNGDMQRLMTLAGVHLVFVVTALATAGMDRIGRDTH